VKKKCIQSFGGETEEKDHLEEMGVDGRILLKSLLNISYRIAWIWLMWLRIGISAWLFRTR
jgi:hypothetical protein